MVVPFGVGVGDLFAVSRLIYQIGAEFKRNPESSADYQDLVIELQALDRALKQLHSIQPAKDDFNRFNATRALALTCKSPLEAFLDKISKFEGSLGPCKTKDNHLRLFSSRIQWSTMYKDDVAELRAKLTPKVSTINILLLTQTTESLARAATDRDSIARDVATKFAAHRVLLTSVHNMTETVLAQQTDLRNVQLRLLSETQAQHHKISHLNAMTNDLSLQNRHHEAHLVCQDAILLDLQADAKVLEGHTSAVWAATLATQNDTTGIRYAATSILGRTLDIMTVVTAGIAKMNTILDLICQIFKLTSCFSTEMRQAAARLLQGFWEMQKQLAIIERMLSQQINLPIIQFRDAFNEVRALPYDLSRQWNTFQLLVSAAFTDRQGLSRVERGQYFITHARMGRRLNPTFWNAAIKPGDELSMTIILDDVEAEDDICPFQSCRTSLSGILANDGVRECPSCYKHSAVSQRHRILKRQNRRVEQPRMGRNVLDDDLPSGLGHYESVQTNDKIVEKPSENIELYYSVQVNQTIPGSTLNISERGTLEVLICDDIVRLRNLLQCQLEDLGCRVTAIKGSHEFLRRAVSEFRFDVIFMEVRLTWMNREDLVTKIRGTDSANRYTPIVCMTFDRLVRPRVHHFDMVIEKPASIAKLKEVLEKYGHRQTAIPEHTAAFKEPGYSSMDRDALISSAVELEDSGLVWPMLWQCHKCRFGPIKYSLNKKCNSCAHSMCNRCKKDDDIPPPLGTLATRDRASSRLVIPLAVMSQRRRLGNEIDIHSARLEKLYLHALHLTHGLQNDGRQRFSLSVDQRAHVSETHELVAECETRLTILKDELSQLASKAGPSNRIYDYGGGDGVSWDSAPYIR